MPDGHTGHTAALAPAHGHEEVDPAQGPGRPPLAGELAEPIVGLARENPGWGVVRVCRRRFLRAHAATILAVDSFAIEHDTLHGARVGPHDQTRLSALSLKSSTN